MIETPKSTRTETLADWAEASCLFGSSTSISEHEIGESLENDGIENSEEIVSNIWQEIDVRHIIAGEDHPIRTLHGMLERIHSWENNLAYAFQLLLAMQSFYPSTRIARSQWPIIGKLYERLSTLALKQYAGGEALNIGVPRENGIPLRFSDCIDYLCEKLKEIRGAERLYTSENRDDGVDIASWIPFGDGRPGQVIILAQCAAGKNWRSKIRGSEISLGLWQQHINFTTQPLRAFIFPFVCVDDATWSRLNHESEGLVLDRLRISSMFVSDDASPSLLHKIREWCEEQLARLSWIEN